MYKVCKYAVTLLCRFIKSAIIREIYEYITQKNFLFLCSTAPASFSRFNRFRVTHVIDQCVVVHEVRMSTWISFDLIMTHYWFKAHFSSAWG